MTGERARVRTGIEGLDRLLGGGLPAHRLYLIQGRPGVGKTTLGHALSRAIYCTFNRVQFTSDILPSDVLGISIYSAMEQRFEYKPGPEFTNV